MNLIQDFPLISSGRRLDASEEALGELRDSSYLLGDGDELSARMQEDGYLFVRGFFKREEVMAARRVMVERLAAEGILLPGTDPMEAVINPGKESAFRPDLTKSNAPLHRLLYGEHLMGFYADFFVVYMGRGTREKLLTAWVPLGDAPVRLGGLMILEGSNRKQDRLRPYLERDVDTYCTNGRHAAEIEAGKKNWEWNGALAKDPASLREKLGGRWLTTDFEAGDLLTFTMQTVHASLDNQSGDRMRFSSDSRYQPASLPADERWVGENPIGHSLAGKRGRIC